MSEAGAPGRGPERRIGLALAALLLVFGGVLVLHLGVPPLASSAEERCADVVSTMVRTGDWLVPRHHGELRLQKPPLFYWEASAAGLAAGDATLTSLRAPSVIAALLVVLLVFCWGRWLYGAEVGLIAAAALATMQSMATLGRIGTAEMTLSLFCNLALFTFSRMHARGQRRLLPLFALWVALAVLAKATAALMIIGLPIAVFLVLQGQWRRALSPRVLAWVAGAVVAGFAWYVIVIVAVDGAWSQVYGELVLPVGVQTGAVAHSATHYGPVWEYLFTIFQAGFPVALLVPVLVGQWVAGGRAPAEPRVRLVRLTFLSLFIAFSLVPQKQKHYLLPLLPSFALLLAGGLADLAARRPARARVVQIVLGLLGVLVGLPLLAGIRILYGEVFGWSAWQWGPVVLAGLLLAGALLAAAWRGRSRRFVALAAIAVLATNLVWYGSIDIWRRQFEDGSVVARPDYVAERWEAAFQHHPFMTRVFRVRERDA